MKLDRIDTCVVCGECVRWCAPYVSPRAEQPHVRHYYTDLAARIEPFRPADIFHMVHSTCRYVWPATVASNIVSYWEKAD